MDFCMVDHQVFWKNSQRSVLLLNFPLPPTNTPRQQGQDSQTIDTLGKPEMAVHHGCSDIGTYLSIFDRFLLRKNVSVTVCGPTSCSMNTINLQGW
jgi:hypothetical protein